MFGRRLRCIRFFASWDVGWRWDVGRSGVQAKTVWVQPKLGENAVVGGSGQCGCCGQGEAQRVDKSGRAACMVCVWWRVGRKIHAVFHRCFAGFRIGFAHVSRGFAHVSRAFHERFAGFRGVSQMFRRFCMVCFTCFTAVSRGFAAFRGGFAL